MGPPRPRPLILDAGALIKLERADVRVRDLISQAELHQVPIVVPAGVLGQAWRDGSRQARLARLLQHQGTAVESLDRAMAQVAGELCGRAGTADVIDATVVLAARLHKGVVATGDADDLRRLDPAIDVVSV